jgi:cobalamin biosynthesis Mg chelatase CobN
MTARDRLVVIVLALLAVLGAVWLLLVSPERKKAATLAAQVSAASAEVASAHGTEASARNAQAQYAAAYASIVKLGKAVPANREVPSLIYQLAQASNEKSVEFSSITAGSGGSSSAGGSASASASAASASASAASGAALAGFTEMPFTFVFNGSFFDLQHLFEQLDNFALDTTSGDLQISGRLLTIQSVSLAGASGSAGAGSGVSPGTLTGTIAATAYVLPPTQGLTGGATPASPASATTTTASTTTAASSPAPPAIARVNP